MWWPLPALAATGLLSASLSAAEPPASKEAWDDAAVFQGLHPAVQEKVRALRGRMEGLGRRVYLMSGARAGPPAASLHNQALAVDVTIDHLDSEGVSAELRAVGFTCVTTYYNAKRKPCFMAHGDLRGTTSAKGPYSPGGAKANDCPPAATSRTASCANDRKAQWVYHRVPIIPATSRR